jgi:alanine dehydrogenase
VRIVRDRDLADIVDRAEAVREMEAGYRAVAAGDAVVFPRSRNEAGPRTLAWLGAALPRLDVLGYRGYLYDDEGRDRGEQVTALYGYRTMELRALFVGRLTGNLRTGAALAAAVRAAEPQLDALTLIGTGTQAREFALSAASALPIRRLTVWSPTREHRERFAESIGRETGLAPVAADSLDAAVRDARAVVLTTSSPRPVVTRDHLRPDALVATIQGYRATQHDVDPRVYEQAETIWTDSVEQASSAGSLFERAPLRSKLEPLGRGLETGRIRDSTARRVVVNTGAPWEEVLMARALLRAAEARTRGNEVPLDPAE